MLDQVIVIRRLGKARQEQVREAPVLAVDKRILLVDRLNRPIAYFGSLEGTHIMFIRSVIDYSNNTYSISQKNNNDVIFTADPILWKLIFNQ